VSALHSAGHYEHTRPSPEGRGSGTRRSGRPTRRAPSSVLGERHQGLGLSSARHRVPPVSLNLSTGQSDPRGGSPSREATSVLNTRGLNVYGMAKRKLGAARGEAG